MQLTQGKSYKVVCYFLAIVLAYLLILRFSLVFSYNLNLEGAEFLFVHFIQILYRGQHLYQNPEVFPFHAVLYTPFYTYIFYAFVRLLGINPLSDVHSVYVIGRLLSLTCFILNLFALNRVILLFNQKLLPRLLCIALFALLMSGHAFAARSDSLQLLLFTGFLYYLFKYCFFESNLSQLVYGLVCALLAILTKQEAVIHIFILLFAFCIYNLRNRRLWFLLAFSLVVLVLGLCYLAFAHFIFINTVLYNVEVLTELKRTYNFRAISLSLTRMLPLAAVVIYLANKQRKAHMGSAGVFAAVVALIYLMITHLMMLRAAASVNYSFPAALFLAISLGILLNNQIKWSGTKILTAYAFTLAYIMVLLFTGYMMHSYRYNYQAEHKSKQEYMELSADKNVIESITKNDTVFFLNAKYTPVFENLPLAYGYDKHIDRLIEILSGQQVHSKMMFLPTDKYDACFENGSIKYIVAENNAVSARQLSEYYSHFAFLKSAGNLNLYKYDK